MSNATPSTTLPCSPASARRARTIATRVVSFSPSGSAIWASSPSRLAAIRTQVNSNRRQDFLDYSGNVRFGYSQDLLATSDEEIRVKQAELSFTRSRSNLDRQQLFLEADVTNSYYNLVESIRRLVIEKQQLEQAKSSHLLAERKYEIWLIAEVETLRLLMAKLNAEASYAGAETVIERRRDELQQVLGMEMTESLEVDTTVAYERIPVDEALAIEVAAEVEAVT